MDSSPTDRDVKHFYQPDPPDFRTSALYFRGLGWCPIPLIARGKHPFEQWRWRYQSRTLSTVEEIDRWARRWSRPNIGLLTGLVSRNLVVLDADYYRGGLASLER